MSIDELEAHVKELDMLYLALQTECKKVKVKTIAALEEKRKRGPKAKKEKAAKKENTAIDDLLKKLMETHGSSLKKETK